LKFLTKLAPQRWRPEGRLALLAWTVALAVQPGTLTGDTIRRLHAAHSLWTQGEPTVRMSDPAILGSGGKDTGTVMALFGRGGKLYVWSGVGQSLLMLPADMAATGAARILGFRGESAYRFRVLVVAYLTFPLLAAATMIVAFRFLRELGFSDDRAVLGCLGLLLASTFFYYCQDQQENSLIFFLSIAGIYQWLVWLRTDSTRALILGAASLGATLLVRITTAVDIAFLIMFVLALLATGPARDGVRGPVLRRGARFLATTVPVLAVFVGLDRCYHFARFGQWTGNYSDILQRQWSERGGLPPDWLWGGPFWEGFWGPVVSPSKSVFLFDPLLILLAALVLGSWARVRPAVRFWLGATLGIFVADLVLHARITWWGAEPAWGPRYHQEPIWLLALVAVPLLAEAWSSLGASRKGVATALVAIAGLVQISSVAMHFSLEEAQREYGLTGRSRRPLFVVGLRFVNIADRLAGRERPRGLEAIPDADWRAREAIFVPNLLPFRLAYRGAPKLAKAAWPVLIALTILSALQLGAILQSWQRGEFGQGSASATPLSASRARPASVRAS
jgi:hypothetical protein